MHIAQKRCRNRAAAQITLRGYTNQARVMLAVATVEKGVFHSDNVPLRMGDNTFTVTAGDCADSAIFTRILDARALFPDCSLAVLYDEKTMPPELRKAHQNNDRAVMEAYGFPVGKMDEPACVAALMQMYQKLADAIMGSVTCN